MKRDAKTGPHSREPKEPREPREPRGPARPRGFARPRTLHELEQEQERDQDRDRDREKSHFATAPAARTSSAADQKHIADLAARVSSLERDVALLVELLGRVHRNVNARIDSFPQEYSQDGFLAAHFRLVADQCVMAADRSVRAAFDMEAVVDLWEEVRAAGLPVHLWHAAVLRRLSTLALTRPQSQQRSPPPQTQAQTQTQTQAYSQTLPQAQPQVGRAQRRRRWIPF
jgi:hypothetical protein